MEAQAFLAGLCFAALLSQGISFPYNDVEHCFDGKTYQAKLYKNWTDSFCYDLEGNQYKDGAILLSCCGCLKLTCVLKDVTGRFYPTESHWNLTKEDSCCEDCHGTVFPAGAIMNVTEEGGICETTRTTRCVYVEKDDRPQCPRCSDGETTSCMCPDGSILEPNRKMCGAGVLPTSCTCSDGEVLNIPDGGCKIGVKGGAVAEMSYGFKNCCTDDNGLNNIDIRKWEPETCSKRTCELPQGNKFASWISSIEKPGCNCCLVQNVTSDEWELIADGEPCPIQGEHNAKCCKGQCLVPLD